MNIVIEHQAFNIASIMLAFGRKWKLNYSPYLYAKL